MQREHTGDNADTELGPDAREAMARHQFEYKKTFSVTMSANAYSEGPSDASRIVQVHIIDILYKDQVCSLVHMQDLTKLLSADLKLSKSKQILKGAS